MEKRKRKLRGGDSGSQPQSVKGNRNKATQPATSGVPQAGTLPPRGPDHLTAKLSELTHIPVHNPKFRGQVLAL
jgi:hypothetical protein